VPLTLCCSERPTSTAMTTTTGMETVYRHVMVPAICGGVTSMHNLTPGDVKRMPDWCCGHWLGWPFRIENEPHDRRGRSLHLSGQPRGSAPLPPRVFHCASLSSRPLGADVQILPGTLLVRLPGTGVAYASALGRECLNDERSPRHQEGRESPFNRVSLVQQSICCQRDCSCTVG
jgi:hypothetical protein